MSELAGPKELVLIGPNGKEKGRSTRSRAWGLRGLRAMRDVNNMADVARLACKTPPHVFTEFLFSEEEEVLFEGSEEDEFVLLSSCCVFSRRKWARISRYFEDTVPRYHCDVFRSHFRMTASTFEMLSCLLSTSEHIPNGNTFGKPCIDPRKQIAIAIWAVANQESSRQISDRFDVAMSSVSRCLRRVTKALVHIRGDFIQWPRGRRFFLIVYFQ